MRAVVKANPVRGGLRLLERPDSRPGPGQVAVRVRAATVCGSDLHAYRYEKNYHFIPIPNILGHEFSGEIAAVGEGVEGWQPGDRVTAESIVYCGRCPRCLAGNVHICDNFRIRGMHMDGAFATLALVEAKLLHRLPPGMTFAQAAAVEPLTVGVHAAFQRSSVAKGRPAVVFGPGPIGLLTAQAARAAGADPVVVIGRERDEPVRLRLARQLGFKTVIFENHDPRPAVAEAAGAEKVDAVFECSGAGPAMPLAVHILVKGGTVTAVGLNPGEVPLPLSVLVRGELSIKASYTGLHADYEKAIQLIAAGQVDVDSLLTPYAFEDYEAAFVHAMEGTVVKPLFTPNG